MTVCIASISENGTIFGAADTMLTAGDVEFEPLHQSQPRFGKIYAATTSIVIMTAGNAATQAEILHSHVGPSVHDAINQNPKRWLSVQEVVSMYCDGWNIVRHKKMERALLSPLGLTHESFLARQKDMTPDFISRVARMMGEFQMESTAAIIAGIEPAMVEGQTFSRLFALDGDDAMCYDTIRFAAIGSGSRHAQSHLMLAKHGAATTLPETLLSTYVAKKRAEVAPGVGADTNMFILGPVLGSFTWLKDEVMKKLDATYRRVSASEAKVTKKANTDIDSYLESVVRAAGTQKATEESGTTIEPTPS